MANSLKAVLPTLAPILGATADALYSHQRAFVAAGLLESAPGRGPGSGVTATPSTVAMFLCCMLTNANLSENVPFARSIAEAMPEGGTDTLTGAATFRDALAAVLSDERLSARVNEIRVQMNGGYAKILRDGREPVAVTLASRPAKVTRKPKEAFFRGDKVKEGWEVEITLPTEMVRALSKAVLALRRW